MLKKKTITCRYCKTRFEVLNPDNVEERVVPCQNPDCRHSYRVNFVTGDTIITKSPEADKKNGFILFRGRKFPLHEGQNIVGREADSSEADVQLELDEKYKFVSRSHFSIHLIRLKKGKTKYVISDLREKDKIDKVPTLVNDEKLDKVDKIVLSHGDTISIVQVNGADNLEVKMTFNTQ